MARLRPSSRSRFLPLAVLAATFALGGCGVKGPLEPPPSATAPAPDAKAGANSGATGTAAAKPRDTGPLKPDQPFILDGLL